MPFADATELQAPKVVYHLSDLERVSSVLGNIHNHYAGMAGDPVEIALVVHGGALRAFRRAYASLDVSDALYVLLENGLVPYACPNTLKAEGATLDDLLTGFKMAKRGGVVKLAELQARGFAYLRP